jgi:DNA replication and repair protein RecF
MLDLAMPEQDDAPRSVCLRRLRLQHFRNYPTLDLALDGRSVVLCGANGSGKTNLLEAVSFLAPGRGLRRATAADLCAEAGPGTWAIAATIDGPDGLVEIGTGLTEASSDPQVRKVRIDHQPVKSSAALADHVAVLWLTPDLDGLFRGAAGDRRRFVDRLTIALDPEHGVRVSALEKALRGRNRLLEDSNCDRRWLDAAEHELAEIATAVAAARAATIDGLSRMIDETRDPSSPFPHAILHWQGEIETWLRDGSAIEAEDRYRELLRAMRGRDAAAGRTTCGAHLSDLITRHGIKGMAAERASTGEQKALLVGLVLAQARLVGVQRGRMPLLLLDEIAAHLDAIRRAGLYEELERIGAQAWLTGTDPDMFAPLRGRAQFFDVANGCAVATATD